MKFMIMRHAPRAGWNEAGIGTWPPADIQAHIGFMLRSPMNMPIEVRQVMSRPPEDL